MFTQSQLQGEEDPLSGTELANVKAEIPDTLKRDYIILRLESALQPPKLKSVVS